jgi:hypothetical protein
MCESDTTGRITNRCTGRRAASVPLLAIGLHSYRQEAGQPLGASELKRYVAVAISTALSQPYLS